MMDRYEDDYDEEDGEISMQLDSPVHHLVNMRPPTTPTTAGRRKSSIRPVARTSDVDFDKIPSPRPLHSTQRSSKNAGPGPSSLSHSVRAREVEPDSDSPNEDAGDIYGDYNNMDNGGFDDYAPDETRTPTQASAQKKKSFGRIDEDVEESEGKRGLDRSRNQSRNHHKKAGRSRSRSMASKRRQPESHRRTATKRSSKPKLHRDSRCGLDPGSDEEEEETPQPPPKKAKVVPEKKPPGPKTASRGKKENKPLREGVRRSQREHYAPLEYWRGEKLVYGRSRNSGPILVPQIKEIVRIPKEHSLPLGGKRKRGSTRARSRSQVVDADEDAIPPALPVVNPEEGWDDDTQAVCTVVHYTSKEEVERRIAMAVDRSWSFDKIFGDDEFIAAGQLIIPPRGRKPSKAAKDNTYIFYVLSGAVNFKIHETSMILATGGMFMVPRGNTYLIENISNRDAKLFFTQARKVEMNDAERAAKAEHIAESQRRKSIVRSSSAGAPASVKTGPPTGAARAKSLAVLPSTSRS
ncbi:Mif2/CENP-C like-domain-containing protein [Pholiota molesta]|nr:Mif2/CENP-C like-domain-containing protein [Pholiota molesta]